MALHGVPDAPEDVAGARARRTRKLRVHLEVAHGGRARRQARGLQNGTALGFGRPGIGITTRIRIGMGLGVLRLQAAEGRVGLGAHRMEELGFLDRFEVFIKGTSISIGLDHLV